MTLVVFACVQNAGRSQMAAAFFNVLAQAETARAISAGTAPAAQVHPAVVSVMHECGIDLRSARPRHLSEVLRTAAPHILITMGCGEACPVLPGVERHDWPLADPHGQSLEQVRLIRETIQQRVAHCVAERGWQA